MPRGPKNKTGAVSTLPRRHASVSRLLLPDRWDTPVARRTAKQRARANELLRIIRDEGPLSRADAARMLGFNPRTISLCLQILEREGLIIKQRQLERPSRGRRPIPWEFNPGAARIVGLDIGRSVAVGTVMDLSGNILVRHESSPDLPEEPERQIRWLNAFLKTLLAKAPADGAPLAGIGLSPEGMLYARRAGTRFAEEADWIARNLETLTGVSVFVEDDSALAALGERWFGTLAENVASIAVLNVTDGLGLGLIINDGLYQGTCRRAGEIGHVPLGDPDIPCYCGGRSCLENTASGNGIERMARQAGLSTAVKPRTAADVLEMVDSSPTARDVVDRFARGLAAGAGVVMDLLNPGVLVLSGRLARHAPVFMESFHRELKRITPPFVLSATPIVVSRLHEDAVTYGTCARVLHQIFGTAQVSLRQAL